MNEIRKLTAEKKEPINCCKGCERSTCDLAHKRNCMSLPNWCVFTKFKGNTGLVDIFGNFYTYEEAENIHFQNLMFTKVQALFIMNYVLCEKIKEKSFVMTLTAYQTE